MWRPGDRSASPFWEMPNARYWSDLPFDKSLGNGRNVRIATSLPRVLLRHLPKGGFGQCGHAASRYTDRQLWAGLVDFDVTFASGGELPFATQERRPAASHNAVNVGVDVWGCVPITIKDIERRAQTLPERMHWADVERHA